MASKSKTHDEKKNHARKPKTPDEKKITRANPRQANPKHPMKKKITRANPTTINRQPPRTTPRLRSEPVTNKPNEELEMGVSGFAEQSPKLRNLWVSGEHNKGESREEIMKTVSGEQNRGETMLAMEFLESRGEKEMKREKEIG